MCWIMTVKNTKIEDTITDVIDNSRRNSQGYSLVFLGENPDHDTVIRTMNDELFFDALLALSNTPGRVFIHLRAATTQNVGIGFTHAFDDFNNVFHMHNGIIANPDNYAVDSFSLAAGNNLRGETYANVFTINATDRTYKVIRKSVGTLFTDGLGDFSSTEVNGVEITVPVNSESRYTLPVIIAEDVDTHGWGYNRDKDYNCDYDYDWKSLDTKEKEETEENEENPAVDVMLKSWSGVS